MKKLLVLVVLLWATILHAQITYWWSQMLKKPDAKQSQEYFFVPGTNIYFTYATNRVIINGSGTNVTIATSTNALYAQYATNWLGSTNFLNSLTNYTPGTNVTFNLISPYVYEISSSGGGGTNFYVTNTFTTNNYFTNYAQSNIYSTNLIDYYTMLQAGTNILLTTNGGYLVVNFTPTNVVIPSNYIANLIAWWKMDAGSGSTAIDSTTNNNIGTLTNSPSWVAGHVGPFALQFNSNSSQGVFVMSLTNLSAITNGTITWWQYHTNAYNDGTQRGMWGHERYVGFYKAFECQVYTDNFWHIGWYDSTSGTIVDMRLTIAANAANWPQNQWIHYAYVWTPTGGRFYTNGTLAQATNVTTIPVDMGGNFPFAYGMLPGNPRVFFNGIMDDFRIYSTNLTDTEIQGVYAYSGILDFYVLKGGDTMTGSLTNQGLFVGNGSPLTNNFGYNGFYQHDSAIDLGGALPLLNGALRVYDINTNLTIDLNGEFGTVTASNFVATGSGFFGNGSGLTNLPCCTNGAYSGSFTGDGSGLTNLNVQAQTNISYTAVTNSPWLTNVTLANLPSGVLTNQDTRVWTNLGGGLYVTGIVTKIEAGSANTLVVTNGNVGIAKIPVGIQLDVSGTVQASTAVAAPFYYKNGTTSSRANYAFDTQLPDGAIPLKLVTGSTTFTNSRVSFFMDGVEQGRMKMTNGSSSFTWTGTVTATNGLYYSAQSNSVVATSVWQPLHTWASMMGFVTNTINGGANTYAIVTNYSTARTNQMTCSLTAGTITNTIDGFYYCAIHMSMKSVDAGALVEGDLLLNGVERDEISFQTQFDPGTPRYKGASAFGILYIPANTQITFQVKSSGANGIEIRRQQLVVMPP